MEKISENKKIYIYKILTILLSIILLIVVAMMAHSWMVVREAQKEYEQLAEEVNDLRDQQNDNAIVVPEDTQDQEASTCGIEETTASEDEELVQLGIDPPEKNLDWDSLRQVNPDIYAWIYIPGTQVDYPILQHPTDDSYYLNYNMNGTRGYPGCIYTEKLNQKDFSDFNTVLYGHNMRNQSMFASLHKFEEGEFFAAHPYIYIYTEDKVLVYEVFAAWLADDAHILKNNDFSTEEGRGAYLTAILKNYENYGNMRNDVTVSTDNHILTLSTCIKRKVHNRFLVQAVLLNEDAL